MDLQLADLRQRQFPPRTRQTNHRSKTGCFVNFHDPLAALWEGPFLAQSVSPDTRNLKQKTPPFHNRGVFCCVEKTRLHEQSIHPFHISRRVGRQAAFGQQGLVEQDVGQVVEVHAAVQLFDQGVVGVDL